MTACSYTGRRGAADARLTRLYRRLLTTVNRMPAPMPMSTMIETAKEAESEDARSVEIKTNHRGRLSK